MKKMDEFLDRNILKIIFIIFAIGIFSICWISQEQRMEAKEKGISVTGTSSNGEIRVDVGDFDINTVRLDLKKYNIDD